MAQLLALAALLQAAPPAATPGPEELVRKSVTDYNLGYYDAALKEIEEAYREDPRPALLYDLAQCHRAMEHWDKAELFYRNYLRDLPNARNRARVLELIDEMAAKKREAAAKPAPSPAPPALVLVEAPATPAPAAAVTKPPEGLAAHTRVWPWVLAAGAGVFAGGTIWGWYEAATFSDYKTTPHTLSQLQGQRTLAEAGFATAIAGGAIAIALASGAVLTW